MLNRDLTKRTQAEEVWLWRRSKGYTMRRAAKALGVGRTSLWKRLKENTALPRPAPRVLNPSLPLILALARRRYGRGLKPLAKELGVSHMTLLKWEARGEEALVGWWCRRGWRFPCE